MQNSVYAQSLDYVSARNSSVLINNRQNLSIHRIGQKSINMYL